MDAGIWDGQLVRDVTEGEVREEVDRRARQRLGISGDEFARGYREGSLPDTPAVNEIGILLSLVDDELASLPARRAAV